MGQVFENFRHRKFKSVFEMYLALKNNAEVQTLLDMFGFNYEQLFEFYKNDRHPRQENGYYNPLNLMDDYYNYYNIEVLQGIKQVSTSAKTLEEFLKTYEMGKCYLIIRKNHKRPGAAELITLKPVFNRDFKLEPHVGIGWAFQWGGVLRVDEKEYPKYKVVKVFEHTPIVLNEQEERDRRERTRLGWAPLATALGLVWDETTKQYEIPKNDKPNLKIVKNKGKKQEA